MSIYRCETHDDNGLVIAELNKQTNSCDRVVAAQVCYTYLHTLVQHVQAQHTYTHVHSYNACAYMYTGTLMYMYNIYIINKTVAKW